MAAPIFYRSNPKWPVCAAVCGAVLIHAAAVALAARSAPPPPEVLAGPVIDVDIIDAEDSAPPPQEIDPLPDIPAPAPPLVESAFVDENPTPPPVRQRLDRPAQRLIRSAPAAPRMGMGLAKVLALSAPRPEYPYEARRQRATGSGMAVLTIDPATGLVTDVRMARSTGHAVLDAATISGFRRWRFKPGTVSSVQTPITYTLTGASF